MPRNEFAALTVALTLAAATSVLAANPPRAPAKESSFAPRPTSGTHVYGAPIGAPSVGVVAAHRKHASPKHPPKQPAQLASKHAAKRGLRQAKVVVPKPPPPPAYATPDPS